MHSFINNKTFNFMTFAIKIRLVFPLKLFVIWQQVKKVNCYCVHVCYTSQEVDCKKSKRVLVLSWYLGIKLKLKWEWMRPIYKKPL